MYLWNLSQEAKWCRSLSHTEAKHSQSVYRISESYTPHLIPPSLHESGFMEVECFTILYIVTTRKMTLTCQKRHMRIYRPHLE